MRSAGKERASFALIIGEDELKAGAVAVKPLKSGRRAANHPRRRGSGKDKNITHR